MFILRFQCLYVASTPSDAARLKPHAIRFRGYRRGTRYEDEHHNGGRQRVDGTTGIDIGVGHDVWVT